MKKITLEQLNKLPVKEISEIAKKMNITLSFKDENGTRKRYNKAQLIDLVLAADTDSKTEKNDNENSSSKNSVLPIEGLPLNKVVSFVKSEIKNENNEIVGQTITHLKNEISNCKNHLRINQINKIIAILKAMKGINKVRKEKKQKKNKKNLKEKSYIFKDLQGGFSSHTKIKGLFEMLIEDHSFISSKVKYKECFMREFIESVGYEILDATQNNIIDYENYHDRYYVAM